MGAAFDGSHWPLTLPKLEHALVHSRVSPEIAFAPPGVIPSPPEWPNDTIRRLPFAIGRSLSTWMHGTDTVVTGTRRRWAGFPERRWLAGDLPVFCDQRPTEQSLEAAYWYIGQQAQGIVVVEPADAGTALTRYDCRPPVPDFTADRGARRHNRSALSGCQ